MKRLRYAIINFILNDNEKYLLASALNNRIASLNNYCIEEKTADVYNTKEDITVLSGMYNKIKFNDK